MELKYGPDFDKVLARFEAWWNCGIIDRPPVSLYVKPDRAPRELPARRYDTLRAKWFDFEYIIDRAEAGFESAVYMGDTFPMFYPNLGPELAATIFGAELEFGDYTSWSKPVAASCRDILTMQPNLDNTYWNAIRDATDLSLQRGAGKWITGLPDLHTNGDWVAALRDPQELCLELMDDPGAVRQAVDYLTTFYALIYEDLWDRIARQGHPSSTWTPTLHAGKSYITNCDFICMISPEMFQQTILPSIVWEMNYLERNLFHLDGPGALRHLDALLAQKRLNGVQWVCGEGRGPAARWIDVYKRIQAAGKCIQLMAADLNDAMAVAEHLRSEGIWFCIGGQHSRDEAQNVINRIASWAAGKK